MGLLKGSHIVSPHADDTFFLNQFNNNENFLRFESKEIHLKWKQNVNSLLIIIEIDKKAVLLAEIKWSEMEMIKSYCSGLRTRDPEK